MQKLNLIGHDKGPGITACVLLGVMIEELVSKKILSTNDVDRILANTDSTLAGMAVNNVAIKDARTVVGKMRGT
jgi:hypothetical protein